MCLLQNVMPRKLWEAQDVGREDPEPTGGFGMAPGVIQVPLTGLKGKEWYARIGEAGDTSRLLQLTLRKTNLKAHSEAYIADCYIYKIAGNLIICEWYTKELMSIRRTIYDLDHRQN